MDELLKFRRANIVPPGGYAYQDPDTEHVFTAGMFDDLVKKARLHREANDLPVPENLAEIIEDWICHRIPIDMTSAYNTAPPPGYKAPLTSTAVTRATTDLLHLWRRMDRKLCPMKEAVKRSMICADCEKNTAHTACMSCKGVIDWVKSWIPRQTPSDKVLYVCDTCAILNVAQVQMHTSILREYTNEKQIHRYPDSCWKKQALQRNAE